MSKKIFILCGGTTNHVSPHFSFSAPAYGSVGLKIYNELIGLNKDRQIFHKSFVAMESDRDLSPYFSEYEIELIPTQMALSVLPDECLLNYYYYLKKAGLEKLETNKDLSKFVDYLISNPDTRCIIMAAAVCDFEPNCICEIEDGELKNAKVSFGKDKNRLSSDKFYSIDIKPSEKILPKIRQQRKDIFVVSFKTTAGVGRDETYKKGLLALKKNSSNLVFANDIQDKINMVVTPEEFPYEAPTRTEAVKKLCEITFKRLNLTFEDKTILKDDTRAFPEELIKEGAIPQNWYDVMKYLFANNAFKPLPGTGKTSGHFGCRVDGKDYERITSERKINHNESFERGMIPVYSYKNGELIVGGAKPSVGEKTQELIYQELGDKIHSIVHFHCPLRNEWPHTIIPIREQLPYECGSRECAINSASGILESTKTFTSLVSPGIYAVHLQNHGPNIAFHKDVPISELIKFIEKYWDLSNKTGGIIK